MLNDETADVFPGSLDLPESLEEALPMVGNQNIVWDEIMACLVNNTSAIKSTTNVKYEYGSEDEDHLEVSGENFIIETSQPMQLMETCTRNIIDKQGVYIPFQTDVKPQVKHHYPVSLSSEAVGSSESFPATGTFPSTNNWPGDYQFDIAFPSQNCSSSKTANYVYSDILDKLYINICVPCIIEFQVNENLPLGCSIRAMVMYEKPEHISTVVKRCRNHSSPENNYNTNFSHVEHFIRCESEDTQYIIDPVSGRQSILVPYINPSAGSERYRLLYKFMCLSSCNGGVGRRSIILIFTLEHNGAILGRRVINLRICACPSRDMKTDESKLNEQCNNEPKKQVVKRTTNTEIVSFQPPSKKSREDDGGPYEVVFRVKDRDTYEWLLKMRELVQLKEYLPPDILKAFHQKQSQAPVTPTAAVTVSSNERSTNVTTFERQNSFPVASTSAVASASSQRPDTVADQTFPRNDSHDSINRWLETISSSQNSQTLLETSFPQLVGFEGPNEAEWKRLDIDKVQMDQICSSFNNTTYNQNSSQESQSSMPNQGGCIRISRVSFKRVTSLKREEQKPQ
ncbi:Tumor protein 63 [Chamberlinius hualienensis]